MRRFFQRPVVRNTICSVLLIAILWAIGHEMHDFAGWLDADNSAGGLVILLATCAVIAGFTYLLARRIDARAGQLPIPRGSKRPPMSRR